MESNLSNTESPSPSPSSPSSSATQQLPIYLQTPPIMRTLATTRRQQQIQLHRLQTLQQNLNVKEEVIVVVHVNY